MDILISETENPEFTHIGINWFLKKNKGNSVEKGQSSQQMRYPYAKKIPPKNLNPYLTAYMKTNSKWIEILGLCVNL